MAQRTIRVPADQTTIQGAINATQTGDTVLVSPGTYFENLVINGKEITLRSTDGAAATILDGMRKSEVILVENTASLATTIDGFTIRNGTDGYQPAEGGIFVQNAGATIQNNTISGNYGFGVGAIGGSVNVVSNHIVTRPPDVGTLTCYQAGPGVYLFGNLNGYTSTSVQSRIAGNLIEGDGTICSSTGINVLAADIVLVENNTIRGNYVGMGFYVRTLNVRQNIVYNNLFGGLSTQSELGVYPHTDPATQFVTNNTFSANGAALGTTPVDATGGAMLTVSLPAGTYTLSAAFGASPVFAGSASGSVVERVGPAATTLALAAQPTSLVQGQTVGLTATLGSAALPAAAVSGTVTFLDGTTPFATAIASGTVTTASTSGLAAGTHQITAMYSGNANLAGASATVTVVVMPQDFSIRTGTPSLTIRTEHHAPLGIQVSAIALNDTISLSCGNLPQYASCTFSPVSVRATGAASESLWASAMVDTDAILLYAKNDAGVARRVSTGLCALLVPFALFGLRRRGARLLMAVFCLCGALGLGGCSGMYPGHTAPGTYTITVTGHALGIGLTRSTTFTLVVTE